MTPKSKHFSQGHDAHTHTVRVRETHTHTHLESSSGGRSCVLCVCVELLEAERAKKQHSETIQISQVSQPTEGSLDSDIILGALQAPLHQASS